MLTTSQQAQIQSMQPYLGRIAGSLARSYSHNLDREDLLSQMNLSIVEQAERDPDFLNQTPGYVSRRAGWAARDYAKRELRGQNLTPTSLDAETQDGQLLGETFSTAEQDLDLVLSVRETLNGLSGRTAQVARMLLEGWKRKDIASHFGIRSQSLSPELARIREALAPVYAAYASA